MDRDELGAWLRLATTPGIGNQTARKLLATFGLPTALFAQPEAVLSQCVSERHARALVTVPPSWPELLEKTWQWLHASDLAEGTARAIITLGDVRYPKKLLDTEDPPLMLYVVGARAVVQGQPFAEGRCLAVVGSRNPTAQGADNAYQFAKALGATGLTIVSGLALGVDAAAHEGALAPIAPDRSLKEGDAPTTIAVVGTGLDRVYPSRHLDLAHRIARHGLLVSEYPLGTPPAGPQLSQAQPHHFRPVAGHAGGGGSPGVWLTDHRQAGDGTRTRGVCDSGFDPRPAIPGLSRPHQARGQAGGVCTRRARRMPLGATGRQPIHG